MKTLTTTRLCLRPLIKADFPAIAAMASDPEVMRYLALDSTVPTYEEACQKAPQILDWPYPEGGGIWAIISRHEGVFIGWVLLGSLEELPDVEIGYRLSRAFWGQGYATEAGRRLADHAFRDLMVGHLIAVVHPQNLASVRVTEKLGLKRSGTLQTFGVTLNRYALSRKHYLERFDRCS
jgi:RimJ/RimL family protein N-acetyltransferase